MDWAQSRILVTGGHGFLGRHLVEELKRRGAQHVFTFSSDQYDLTRQADVAQVLADSSPAVVFHLAARVGGIGANQTNPGRYFYDNAMMGIELMEQSRRAGVEKYVQVGTVCSYPKFAPVPFSEEGLWDGFPEETNAPYGIAKKALIVQAQAYRAQYGFHAISLLPANMYGPGDNFDLVSSHVIPALIHKFVEAVESKADSVTIWGTGTPTREFLYVEDCARGIALAAEKYDSPEPVNLGTGKETSIKELVELIAGLTGFKGRLVWDTSKPDGQPRRSLGVERAKRDIGFQAEVSLEDGLRRTIDWYLSHRG